MKNKQLLRATFIIFSFIYMLLLIYEVSTNTSLDEIFQSSVKSLILTGAYLGLGFCIVVIAIVGYKNYHLSNILDKKSNGRYYSTSGILPELTLPKIDKISFKDDLPPDIITWLDALGEESSIRQLFLVCAGLLKSQNLFVQSGSSIRIYVHSIAVTSKLLSYANNDVMYCAEQLDKNNCSASSRNTSVIKFLIDSELLPLVGIAYDLGKLLSVVDASNAIYTESCYQKTKSILGSLPEFWRLPENVREVLIFAVSNYQNLENAPKMFKENRLVIKNITAKVLIQLLNIAIHEVGVVDLNPQINDVPDNEDTITVKGEVEQNTSSEPLLNIPKPKNKQKVPKDKTRNQKLEQKPRPNNIVPNTDNPIKINQVFSHVVPSDNSNLNDDVQNINDSEIALDRIFTKGK